MASMSQMADDIFTCTLCLEKVREPRTLPCLHTFCRYCLSAYVRQTVRDWAFPCPLCSQETRPPTKGLPVDQWLETFPTSNFLQQLTRVTEARQAERACDICRQEQVLVEAAAWCRSCMEALCSDCHRVHTRSRASRDHVLISMDSLMNDPLDKLVGMGARGGGAGAQCADHRGKTTTLVCVDCKKLACETCIALTHTACRRIEQASKVTPIFRNDVANAKKHIDDHARAAGHVAERVEEHLEQLTKSRDVAVEEVESLKRRLVEMVEARSAKLLTDIESTYSQQREVLAQRAAQGRALERVLNRTTRFLEHLLAYGTEPDLLGNFDNIVQQTRLVDSQTAAVKQGNDNTTLKFIPDKKATETLRNLTSLGEVKVIRAGGRGKDPTKDENFTKNGKGDNKQVAVASPRLSPRKVSSFGKSPRATPSKSPRAKLVASFSGRTNSDTMRTDLRGVVCLRSGDIIVMDVHFRNKRLKKFSPRGKLISVVDTGECPYGMALIPDTDLVVTHPRSREFVFVTAGGTLHVTGRIKTPKSYFSLASSSTDGVLAAVGSNPPEPPSIDIISFDGEVLSTISLDRIRFPLPPKDICLPPSGDVLLLFSAKETLVCMTYDGTVKYSFQSTQPQDVKRPVSVDGDAQGNAYIADVEGHKIHVITKEGKYGGEVLSRKDGLREPLALYVTEGGHVVVTLGSGDVKTYVT
ncbi:hypothetical protein BaRGS_00027576 [Batillaria attramentaria]|uniref:Uncharacterized protein n=1 Tax=Batillaria attramentaria TaxID=370345 RepID=A0ABD0K1U7_9CAEN